MISKIEKERAISCPPTPIVSQQVREVFKDVGDILNRAATELSALTGNPQRWASFKGSDRVQIYSISTRLLSVRLDLREALRGGIDINPSKLR